MSLLKYWLVWLKSNIYYYRQEHDYIMHNRIKQVREATRLSQATFGYKLGLGLATFRNLEQGGNQLTQPLFELICSTFNVSPDWLRTGNGRMFLTTYRSSIEDLKIEYSLSKTEYKLLKAYLELPINRRNEFADTLLSIYEKTNTL